MSVSSESVKGRCIHCQGHIEFDAEYLGESITCPHCGKETPMLIDPEPAKPKPKAAKPNNGLMAECTACGGEVSSFARSCVHCGQPFSPKNHSKALTICGTCRGVVSIKARSCPHCGEPFMSIWDIVVRATIAFIIACLLLGAIAGIIMLFLGGLPK